MTFHTTVATQSNYDLAFTGTNPKSLRLMMPHGAGHDDRKADARVLIGIFYSNPQKLEVHMNRRVVLPRRAVSDGLGVSREVDLQPGDYVAVRVTEAISANTLRAEPIARCGLTEFYGSQLASQ